MKRFLILLLFSIALSLFATAPAPLTPAAGAAPSPFYSLSVDEFNRALGSGKLVAERRYLRYLKVLFFKESYLQK